ncbi:hypothetical protein T05_12296, partial [Trichinella murrelli]
LRKCLHLYDGTLVIVVKETASKEKPNFLQCKCYKVPELLGAQTARKDAKKHISYQFGAWIGFLNCARFWASSSSSLHERQRFESSLPKAKKKQSKDHEIRDKKWKIFQMWKMIRFHYRKKKSNEGEILAEVETTLLTNQAQNHRYKRSNLNKCSVQFKKLKNVDNKDEKLLMRKTQQCRYGKGLKNKNRTAILNFTII